jgi:cytidylate kinase
LSRNKEVNMSLITLTHPIGCSATEIAHRVADRLNVNVYDDTRLKLEGLRMGLTTDHLKGLQEHPPGWYERLVNETPGVHLKIMESVIYEAARQGEGVIVGHGSQVLLHEFNCALHVLITGETESRARNLMAEMNLHHEAARELVRKSDNRKKGYFRYNFHKDWDDPTLYDLCINPEKVGAERAADLIVEVARSPALKGCSVNALAAIERLSQTRRIEASLMEMDIRQVGLRVDMPKKGHAHISGVVFDHRDRDRIPDIVRKVPGVDRVELDVTLVPTGYD